MGTLTVFIIRSDSCASKAWKKIGKTTVAVLQGTMYIPFYSLGCVVSCTEMLFSLETFFKHKYVSQMVSREMANVILQTFPDFRCKSI